jgi:lysozyme
MRWGLFALALAGCGGLSVGELEEGVSVCANGATVNGVDVSHYDGTIDWMKAAAGGITFAIMKASEGTTFVDPTFATNWANAGAAGVIRGAYHFFRPADDATAQADYFLQIAGSPAYGDLPLAIDLEVTDNLTGAQVAAGAQTFLQRVQQKTGRTPLIYTSHRVMDTLLGSPTGFSNFPLWVANWGVSCPGMPSEWSEWAIWQSSATATVPGISSMVDLDQFNGTLGQLHGFVGPPSQSSSDGGTTSAPDLAGGSAADAGSGGALADAGDGTGGLDGGNLVAGAHGCSFATR